MAAPGDAFAEGVRFSLSARVAGNQVISATGIIGTATAPPGGGTDSSTLVPVTLQGALGVSASGTVNEVAATRGVSSSSASASVSNFDLDVLGVQTLSATTATGSASCPGTGAQDAATTLTGVQLFGTPVTLNANAGVVTGSAAVTVPGMVGATLNARLLRIEGESAEGAAADVINAEFTLVGTVGGVSVTIPAGRVLLALAVCERPATPVANSISPNAGPESGGQTVTITGTNFVPNGTDVTFDGVPATNVAVAPDGNSLTAVTPPGAVGPASVVVSTVVSSAPPLDYTYLAAVAAPVIKTVNPDEGPTSGGTKVRVTGSGFVPGQTTVTICGRTVPADVAPDGTSLTFITPACAAGDSALTVNTPSGTSKPFTFRYFHGGLPVTGESSLNTVVAGLVLAAGGALILLLARRRRIRQ